MGRAPCCDKANVKRGPWSPEEDRQLKEYIERHGTGGNWISLPQKAGLRRCGKSCRLRWLNYLRPNIKLGDFSDDEDRIICSLFAAIGSRWSIIAAHLPGRTDNDIKNYWNTKLKKRLLGLPPPPSAHSKPHHHHQHMNQQRQPLLFLPPISIEASSPPSLIPSSPAQVPDLEGIPVSPHLLSSLTATSSLPVLFGRDQHHHDTASENGMYNGGLEMEMLLLSSLGRTLASPGNSINYCNNL